MLQIILLLLNCLFLIFYHIITYKHFWCNFCFLDSKILNASYLKQYAILIAIYVTNKVEAIHYSEVSISRLRSDGRMLILSA